MPNDMNFAEKFETIDTITTNLQRLMRARNISEAELARQTGTPQPTLHKILSGKTENPRASTLKALADFFDISMDELLTGEIITQRNSLHNTIQSIPIISWDECIDNFNFVNSLTPTNWCHWTVCETLSKNAFALISKPSMEPRFPKGTILIIDPNTKPVDGDFAIVHYPNTSEATLREFSIDGPIRLLLQINGNGEQSNLDNIKILGILIKSIFSYHS
jgi:SOS-response transcriptional repressor LexA